MGGVKLVTHLLPLRPVEGRPDRKSCRQLGRPLLGLSPNLEVANTEDHAATSASTLQPSMKVEAPEAWYPYREPRRRKGKGLVATGERKRQTQERQEQGEGERRSR